MRMSSNQKKFSIVLDEIQPSNTNSRQNSPDKREKSMLIVHSEKEAKATAHHKYVDPNSLAYQNAVLE